jgi:cobalt-zinc-cadmium efflux system membrane fusion protein
MKRICISLVLTFLLIGIETSCQKSSYHENKEEKQIAQNEKIPPHKKLKGEHKRKRGKQTPQIIGEEHKHGRIRKKEHKRWDSSDAVELTPEEMNVVKIKTIKATHKSLSSQLQAMGKVLAHPMRKAIVSYAFPARISQIHVRIGDWVKMGQKLITLQSEEVGTAKSEFYKAKADHELAKVNFEREKRLHDRGVGAKKNYFSSEAELKVAAANLDAAEKKLHVLGFTEEQVKTISETHQINPIITLFAPIGGKVIENKAVLGAMVDQETEILTIMDPTLLCIDAEIYEKDIAKIRKGQSVEVVVPAYPGEKFMGKISYISDVLKEETRTITVRSEVDNKKYKLKSGMFADIKIFLNHQSQVIVLPIDAILDDKDRKIVFIKKEGKFFPQVVELGAREDHYVEILRGVNKDDEVVIKGSYQLKSKLYDEILKKGHVH